MVSEKRMIDQRYEGATEIGEICQSTEESNNEVPRRCRRADRVLARVDAKKQTRQNIARSCWDEARV